MHFLFFGNKFWKIGFQTNKKKERKEGGGKVSIRDIFNLFILAESRRMVCHLLQYTPVDR